MKLNNQNFSFQKPNVEIKTKTDQYIKTLSEISPFRLIANPNI